MKRKIIFFIVLLNSIFLIGCKKVNAAYNYKPGLDPIESALSMDVTRTITNANLVNVNGNLADVEITSPTDIFTYDNMIFIADESTNRIIKLNENYEYIESFPKKDSEYQLKSPQGIFVKNDLLYIADTENYRIVVVDLTTNKVVRIVENPQDQAFEGDTKFSPEKLVVDRSGRLLVVAKGIFEGIMEFDPEGNFTRYYGTNEIKLSFIDSIIYKFSTKKQREKMKYNLQSSFTSISIDDFGYIYTVSNLETSEPVKKLNFKGKNIMMNNGYIGIVGDNIKEDEKALGSITGPSNIIDVAVNEDNNRFSILDSKRGRIFTYDIEGHLLYISGQLGTQNSSMQNPTSIEYLGEKILVSDKGSKSILVYEPTTFGTKINLATKYYYDMDYENSYNYWQEVIRENSNYFLAYAGIGKTQLRNQEWELAIENLKRGHDYYNYSKAYEQYRNIRMKKYLPYVLIAVFSLSGYGLYRSIRASVKREDD